MANADRIVVEVFPDGSGAETLVSAEEARALRRAASAAAVDCCYCGSDLVHPLDWERMNGGWLVTLRCPECRLEFAAAFDEELMQRFIAQLHAQKRALAHDLARLSLGRFAEDAQRFVAALRAGHILPSDF
jgi:hypothetical protein